MHIVTFLDFYSIIDIMVIKRWMQHVARNEKEGNYIKGLLGLD